MANVTTTTAAAIIPEIWEAEVEFAAHNNRGFSGRIMEFEFAGPGDVLHIPKIGAISAARRSFLSNGLPMQKQMTQSLSMGNMVTTIELNC